MQIKQYLIKEKNNLIYKLKKLLYKKILMLGLVSLYAFNKTELYDLKFNFLKVF